MNMGLTVTRELRFGSIGGRPGLLRIGVTGPVQPGSGYIVNVKAIDAVVNDALGELLQGGLEPRGSVALGLWRNLPSRLPAPARLRTLETCFLPLVGYSISDRRPAVLNVTHQFEFSAGHRLYAPSLSEEENWRLFGKCVGWH